MSDLMPGVEKAVGDMCDLLDGLPDAIEALFPEIPPEALEAIEEIAMRGLAAYKERLESYGRE